MVVIIVIILCIILCYLIAFILSRKGAYKAIYDNKTYRTYIIILLIPIVNLIGMSILFIRVKFHERNTFKSINGSEKENRNKREGYS